MQSKHHTKLPSGQLSSNTIVQRVLLSFIFHLDFSNRAHTGSAHLFHRTSTHYAIYSIPIWHGSNCAGHFRLPSRVKTHLLSFKFWYRNVQGVLCYIHFSIFETNNLTKTKTHLKCELVLFSRVSNHLFYTTSQQRLCRGHVKKVTQ